MYKGMFVQKKKMKLRLEVKMRKEGGWVHAKLRAGTTGQANSKPHGYVLVHVPCTYLGGKATRFRAPKMLEKMEQLLLFRGLLDGL